MKVRELLRELLKPDVLMEADIDIGFTDTGEQEAKVACIDGVRIAGDDVMLQASPGSSKASLYDKLMLHTYKYRMRIELNHMIENKDISAEHAGALWYEVCSRKGWMICSDVPPDIIYAALSALYNTHNAEVEL